MADKTEDKVVTKTEESTTKLTEIEQKASESGWKPEAEYDGEKKWIGAEEFLERQELYDGIHKSNRKVKKLEKVLETLMSHNKKIEEVATQKALELLKQEKIEAAKENDVHKVVVLDEKISEIKEQRANTKANTPDTNEIMDEFKESNPWFDSTNKDYDGDMHAYANGLGHRLETEHDDWAPEKILQEVAKRTKDVFEWKLKNQNRKAAPKVSAKSGSEDKTPKDKTVTFDELSPEGKQMYKVLVKDAKSNPHGVMTAEQYLADYTFAQGSQKRGRR